MTGLFERDDSQTSELKDVNLSEWDTEELRDTFDDKAERYDEVKEKRDHPNQWDDGDTFSTHEDRLASLDHGLTLIEDELIRRGEIRSPGKGSYRPMT